MLVLALNPGHDGAFAAVKDRALLYSLESEKDSFTRFSRLTASTILGAMKHLDEAPDVVALCGGFKGIRRDFMFEDTTVAHAHEGVGYFGSQLREQQPMNFLGKEVTLFSTTHERSHIMGAIGMAPRDDSSSRAVLVWEGAIGSFYLVDGGWNVTGEFEVLLGPGIRYASLFALADPRFPGIGYPRNDDSGKLMALAAFGDANDAGPAVAETVDRILTDPPPWPFRKEEFRDSPIHNAGVEADVTKIAASLLSKRIFEIFSAAAWDHLPRDVPLHIAGGCGLNCDWNIGWRELGQFSSVFVPPCPNDSGLAIGSALDALVNLTGDPYVEWDVYSGLEFVFDREPDTQVWHRRTLDMGEVADALAAGRVFAWVQGRAEIGPRALGNRSLLAEPFESRTRDRLNKIKKRERYRPIAPVCRIEDAGKAFDRDFADPYMLYFRMARSDDLGAVTHVDGSARCQTVSKDTNRPLHDLLTVFGERHGIGVLCNTSLNFKGRGFINRMSDLVRYCETQGVDDIVVGDAWFQLVSDRPTLDGAGPPGGAGAQTPAPARSESSVRPRT